MFDSLVKRILRTPLTQTTEKARPWPIIIRKPAEKNKTKTKAAAIALLFSLLYPYSTGSHHIEEAAKAKKEC